FPSVLLQPDRLGHGLRTIGALPVQFLCYQRNGSALFEQVNFWEGGASTVTGLTTVSSLDSGLPHHPRIFRVFSRIHDGLQFCRN
ncbi:MAG TPA: hypothetical protein DCS07_00365, partial [Bdellovibrionales bacterium]|nr:hypothetical protein [Bdellovibrionales bacterium]